MKSQHDLARSLFGDSLTPPALVRAYGEVKKATLMAQQEYGSLYPSDYFALLMEVTDEIIEGKLDHLFTLPLKQGGAGTSLHMNINEVIASETNGRFKGSFRADPLDHIGRYQSTNDTFPTAIIVVLYRDLSLIERAVITLQERLVSGETRWSNVLLVGRTELQDALPITLGQVFGGWAGMVERDRWRLNKLKERIRTIPLGGTAIGTCFSAPRDYIFKAERFLREITELPLCRSQNLPDAVAHHDALSELASGYGLLGDTLYRIASDLLLYTSSLVGEIKHPNLQYGSTIMPFKTNPVILEYVKGVAIGITHERDKIASYIREGIFQLNPFLPFVLESFLSISVALEKSISLLSEKFFDVLEVNTEKMMGRLLASPALLNTLRPLLGYGRIKELLQDPAVAGARSPDALVEVLASKTSISKERLARWLDPSHLTSHGEELE